VKADYEEAKFVLQKNLLIQSVKSERSLETLASGEQTFSHLTENLGLQDEIKQKKQSVKGDDDSDDEELDSDDERLMESLKQKRLETLQILKDEIPDYGGVDLVTLQELSSVVKMIDSRVPVVVHLYENHIKACVRLNLSLAAIAKQFPKVRFLKMKAFTSMPGYKEAGLPAFLIYKNAVNIHTLIAVEDEIRSLQSTSQQHHITDDGVARFLAKYEVLSLDTSWSSSSSSTSPSNLG
jgi:hypothetical protein